MRRGEGHLEGRAGARRGWGSPTEVGVGVKMQALLAEQRFLCLGLHLCPSGSETSAKYAGELEGEPDDE